MRRFTTKSFNEAIKESCYTDIPSRQKFWSIIYLGHGAIGIILTLCPDNSKIIFARGFFLLLVNRHPVTIESPSAFKLAYFRGRNRMYIVHVMVKLHGYITKLRYPVPLYIIKELLVLQNPWPLIHQKKTSELGLKW